MKNKILVFTILFVMFLFPFAILSAGITDTGWLSPTITSQSDWESSDNAWASDNQYATTTGLNYTAGYKGFGFDIPAGVEIVGIEMRCEAKASADSSNVDYGIGKGAPYGEIVVQWNEIEAFVVAGGSGEMWGKSLVVSDFNNDLVKFQVQNTSSGVLKSLDHLQVKVYYFVEGNILTITSQSVASTTAYIGDLINSVSPFLWLIIGLPLGFWIINETIKLITPKKVKIKK